VPFHIRFIDVASTRGCGLPSGEFPHPSRTLCAAEPLLTGAIVAPADFYVRHEVAMNRMVWTFLRAKAKGVICLAFASFILACAPHPAAAQFTQQGSNLVASDGDMATQGFSVAISADGNTAIVGGPADQASGSQVGAAFVFTRVGSTWSEQAKLVGTGYVLGTGLVVRQGQSVALSADGNTAIIGGPNDNNSIGAAWVFTRSGSTWSQQGSKLLASDAADQPGLGFSVALSADGNTAAIGGWLDNNEAGAAWVFTRSSGAWTQQGSKLVGANAVGGALQGFSVALSGDGNTAIIGGPYDNTMAGAAWVFTRSGGAWTQQGAKLVGSNAVETTEQGSSVALSADGNTAIIGGRFDNSNAGAAWVFTRSGGVWAQQGAKLVGSSTAYNQGYSVALSNDGNTAAVGAPDYNDQGLSGSVFVFTRSGSTWTQQGTPLVGIPGSAGQEQGYGVALSGNAKTLLSGGPGPGGGYPTGVGATWVFVAPDFNAAATHDFNGDGYSDIAWRDTSGDLAVWLMAGTTVLSSGGVGGIPSVWSIVGQRDFNGDGMADLLWRDTSGDTSMWFMNGTSVSSTASVGNIPTNWSVVGVGDFNGDGIGDILWQDSSGDLAVWLMNGATVMSSAGLGNVPTATWTVVGIGDFNGDGMADVLWGDTAGDTSIWFMNGTTVSSSASVGNIPTNWSVVGTGDFNGDGRTDIVWRDTAGDISIWLMNGASVLAAGGLGNVPTTFSIALVGDYNGDGMSDLLWGDNLGNTSLWFMNGTTVASTGSLGNIPTTWTVQSVNAE
jgi:hypothetical protein